MSLIHRVGIHADSSAPPFAPIALTNRLPQYLRNLENSTGLNGTTMNQVYQGLDDWQGEPVVKSIATALREIAALSVDQSIEGAWRENRDSVKNCLMAVAAGLTAERGAVGQFLDAPNGAENISEQLQGVIDNLSLVPTQRPSNMYRSQPAQAGFANNPAAPFVANMYFGGKITAKGTVGADVDPNVDERTRREFESYQFNAQFAGKIDAKVIGTSGVVNPTNMKFDFGEGDKEATHFGRVLPARRTDSPSNSGYN